MEYQYPQLDRTTGYAWNAMQRIEQEVGIKPDAMGDSSGQTFVNFSRALTIPEKALLDALMAVNPTLPSTIPGSKFVIQDIWGQRTAIGVAMGFPYRVFYSQSVPGSGVVDQVEIHFSSVLTTAQRNKILSEYGKLITLK